MLGDELELEPVFVGIGEAEVEDMLRGGPRDQIEAYIATQGPPIDMLPLIRITVLTRTCGCGLTSVVSVSQKRKSVQLDLPTPSQDAQEFQRGKEENTSGAHNISEAIHPKQPILFRKNLKVNSLG